MKALDSRDGYNDPGTSIFAMPVKYDCDFVETKRVVTTANHYSQPLEKNVSIKKKDRPQEMPELVRIHSRNIDQKNNIDKKMSKRQMTVVIDKKSMKKLRKEEGKKVK